MFFLKAVTTVLTAVAGLQFTAPGRNQRVTRVMGSLKIHWIPNLPMHDLPKYELGYCKARSLTECRKSGFTIYTFLPEARIQIDNFFKENGFFQLVVFVPGDPDSEGPLYEGPIFGVFPK